MGNVQCQQVICFAHMYDRLFPQVLSSCTEDKLQEALDRCEWRYTVESLGKVWSVQTKGEFAEKACRYFLVIQPMVMIQEFMEGMKPYGVCMTNITI